MDAPLKSRGRRSVVAALASGVVISLTAMTTGIAPAFADPKADPVSPTTIVAVPEPAPVQQAPQEAPAPKPQQQAPVITEPPAAPPVAPVVPQAPVSVEAPPPPKVPEAPVVTQAPVTQTAAPQTQAPAIAQAPPKTQAPVTKDAPVTQSVPAKPPTVAPTTAASAPATSAEPPAPPTTRRSVAPSAAPTPAEPAPNKPDTAVTSAAPAPVTTSASALPSEGSTPPSPALVGPPSAEAGATASVEAGTTPTSAAESSSTERTSGVDKTVSSSVSQAAKEIETLAPETLKAPEQDVVLAKSAKPIEQLDPVVAPKQDVDAIAKAIDLPNFDRDIPDARDRNDSRRDDRDDFFPGGDRKWDRNVRQWDPNWVEYDDYYRPVLSNPYRNPVKIVYIYQNSPRIVYIPPLARIILEVAQFAAYSFTAIVTNTINQAVNVAVGSFFGGGYYPGVGLPYPPPPPPLFRYDNVPVQVRYSNNQVYEPFRVQRIVDVGDDRQYGERKVLLDGVTPAWGEWNQTPTGERQFEVHRTQQFPGLDEPREGPLPGDYQLRLASDESPSGFKGRDAFLLTTAVVLGALSLIAVGWAVLLGRRRTQH
jgi:hypothetical protein